VLAVHAEAYLAALRARLPDSGFGWIDADTYLTPDSLQAAMGAAGGAVAAVDAVMTGQAETAFSAARPPGHHAGRDYAMGFCLLNNAAIAARRAQIQHGAERIAIVDFDVHHGNGTQDIFWDDPSVLYASVHQLPGYPGTGDASERGAAGNVANVPLPPGTGSERFRRAVESVILPALRAFAPDLLIISAGFDAHHRDPLGHFLLGEADFAWITAQALDAAAPSAAGRAVSVLEGGYDLEAITRSAAAHIAVLAGESIEAAVDCAEAAIAAADAEPKRARAR
jgi:acetoin utilization deacetylase AcuC-like enzyme